jgi:hypothetical protein
MSTLSNCKQATGFIETAQRVHVVETIEIVRHGINTVFVRVSTERPDGSMKSSKWISMGMNHRCALERMTRTLKGTLYQVECPA